MFASAQCLGYYLDHGQLTKELCYPHEKTILKQIKEEVKKRKVKAIFVATDSDDMKAKIMKITKKKVRGIHFYFALSLFKLRSNYLKIGICSLLSTRMVYWVI